MPMRRIDIVTIVALVVIGFSWTSGSAETLRYIGKHPHDDVGVIELGKAQQVPVEIGTDIPGWGRVKAVRDSYLVVEHVLAPAQMAELRERGALVHDTFEVHVPREDLRQGRRPSR